MLIRRRQTHATAALMHLCSCSVLIVADEQVFAVHVAAVCVRVSNISQSAPAFAGVGMS